MKKLLLSVILISLCFINAVCAAFALDSSRWRHLADVNNIEVYYDVQNISSYDNTARVWLCYYYSFSDNYRLICKEYTRGKDKARILKILDYYGDGSFRAGDARIFAGVDLGTNEKNILQSLWEQGAQGAKPQQQKTDDELLTFTPDPAQFEYIGKKTDGRDLFYEPASVTAAGQRVVLLMLQVDSENRILHYYKNVVINPEQMLTRAEACELRDYSGELLEDFALPNIAVAYKQGDLTDKLYRDLLARGIVHKPAPAPAPAGGGEKLPIVIYREPAAKSDWRSGFSGGEEVIVDLYDDSIIANI